MTLCLVCRKAPQVEKSFCCEACDRVLFYPWSIKFVKVRDGGERKPDIYRGFYRIGNNPWLETKAR